VKFHKWNNRLVMPSVECVLSPSVLAQEKKALSIDSNE
jgi:hypothetical protein